MPENQNRLEGNRCIAAQLEFLRLLWLVLEYIFKENPKDRGKRLDLRKAISYHLSIIIGQKTWSTVAHLADYAWMIVRTDPGVHRHKSISMIVVDNKSPGIAIRPLINIA